MNLAEFIDTYREAITQQVIDHYPPLYRPSPDERPMPTLRRRPLAGQENAIRGAALSLESQQGSVIVGEMGCGKTFIAVSAAHLAGFRRILVLAPPHLTKKWQREVLQTLAGADAPIITSLTDLERLKFRDPSRPLFAIMSRERAKLSYRWKPAVVWRWARTSTNLLRTEDEDEPYQVPSCPQCGAVIRDSDGAPLTAGDLSRRRQRCDYCGGSLWTADPKGPKRYPLADYIKHRMPHYWELLIADEVHEYKARGSAQGIAAGILANVCDKSLTLTGTLMGGYASTLFHLLYRFSPEIRTQFGQTEESRWIKRYGFEEITITKNEDVHTDDGRASRRKGYKKRTKEKPGLAPDALFHLIGNSVFLRLSDVAQDLPPYEEEVILTPLDQKPDPVWDISQLSAYRTVQKTLKQEVAGTIRRGSKRLLATYLQTLLAYPDGCTKGETVLDPDTKDIIVQMPPLSEDRLYPKEEALVNLIAGERLAGRRTMVYVTHTGTRDITPRWSRILREQGFRVAVLKADTVQPEHREAWMAKRVEEGVDVLMCHPRLVQTGLDLIDFPTICWAETDYSVYTMRQASRRSWRIGQDKPVRVVFMAYQQTIQAEALKLVAKKLTSSLAVEGELTEDGLASYGDDGDDLMLSLAHQVVSGIEEDQDAPVEEIFRKYRNIQDQDELFLVDDGWNVDRTPAPTPEPEPVTAGYQNGHPSSEKTPEKIPVQISLADFVNTPDLPPTRRRKTKPQPAGRSLFQWAIENEEAALV